MPITREQLHNYIFLRREVDNQLERLIRMHNDALIPALKQGDGSQHSAGGRSDRMTNAIHRRLTYEAEIAEDLEQKMDELATIKAAVKALKDPQEREVLRLRYIDCPEYRHTGWKDIAQKLYYTNDESKIKAVQRIHKRALYNIR